jgi:hypothetical protein
VVINVLNKNQAPRVTVADSTVINAGESLSLTVNAFEPDFEPLTWACLSTASSRVNLPGPPP